MTDRHGLHFDLLEEAWISCVDSTGGETKLPLPDVMTHLGQGTELEFTALQAHQQQPWFAFLVQAAAMVLGRNGQTSVEHPPDFWRLGLLDLAQGDPAAWCLVVDDLARPAFFQPPVPEGSLASWKKQSTSPEIFDILIAAKNFDIKLDRYSGTATAEQWCLSLITLQTMEGFLGRGNYGIARMNGGFASRPEVALAPDLGWAARFCRDVALLLGNRQAPIFQDLEYASSGNIALVWTVPWDGRTALELQELDPYFLEICRRVRLSQRADTLRAHFLPSHSARVAAKELAGNVGDPWTPVSQKREAALTISEGGFHYRLLHDLFFGKEYSKAPAFEPMPADDGSMLAVFRALARGQGKTGGFHERQIWVPGEVVIGMRNRDRRSQMAKESKARVELAFEARMKVLRLALLVLHQEKALRSENAKLNRQDDSPAPWVRRFDQEVDRIFFAELFYDLAHVKSDRERDRRWQCRLLELAESLFQQAEDCLAPSGVHRYRAIAKARAVFQGKARAVLPEAFPSTPPESGPPPISETPAGPDPLSTPEARNAP